jgi:hypothetical protein
MKSFFLVIILTLTTAGAVFSQNPYNINFSAERALDWTNLFYRSSGWFGADGIYTIPLDGVESSGHTSKKTLFIFSDTMIGQVEKGILQPNGKMIHNSVAILSGNQPDPKKIKFYWKKKSEDLEGVFAPKTPKTGAGDYYWLGDGFVNKEINNSIFIFGYRVKSVGSGAFGFEEVGNTLIKINSNEPLPYDNYEQKDTPFFLDKGNGEKGSFGAGIFLNTAEAKATKPDGYIYVYGVLGKDKKLLVARVKPVDFEDYSKWTYWNAKAWTTDIEMAAAVSDQVSNELSVSELPDGRYVLIFQENGLGRNVCMRIGGSPIGPFGPVIKVWDTSEALELKGFFSYNAKAHPSLSAKGELLVSYNVNSFNFFKDLETQPNLYRPRFIKIKFKK